MAVLVPNGITRSGEYAVAPVSLADFVRSRRARASTLERLPASSSRAADPAFVGSWLDLADVGWGVVLPRQGMEGVRAALEPLLALRRGQAGEL